MTCVCFASVTAAKRSFMELHIVMKMIIMEGDRLYCYYYCGFGRRNDSISVGCNRYCSETRSPRLKEEEEKRIALASFVALFGVNTLLPSL